MSRGNDEPSKPLLLRIEQVCERYERDVRDGEDLAIESYLRSFHGEDYAFALRELKAIRREYQDGIASDASLEAVKPGSLPHSERFEYCGRLGVGGSGAVWKAHDRQLDRWVAIKLSHQSSPSVTERFVRESRVVAKLQHPNIIRIHEVIGENSQPLPYQLALVCEFIDGRTLSQCVQARAFSIEASVDLLIQVADAMHYAHGQQVVHRDLKPQNILIDQAGRPHVTDFGLASDAASDCQRLTITGEVIGTPAFMAPELARGDVDSADARTDVYSLGAVLFYLLTTDVPFRGSVAAVVHQVAFSEVPSPRKWDATIPLDLETICLKCMEKSPLRRYQNMAELRDELIRFRHGKPLLSRPLGRRERLWRWCRRYPQVASLLSLVFVLLLAVAIGSTTVAALLTKSQQRERSLRLAAQSARADALKSEHDAVAAEANAIQLAQRAKQEARVSRQAVDFLQSLLSSADPIVQLLQQETPPVIGAGTPTLRESLVRAADRIENELSAEPQVQAALMDTLANASRGLGMYDRAQELLETAAATRGSQGSINDLAQHYFYRGWLASDLGDFSQADDLYVKALLTLTDESDHDLLRAKILFQRGQLMHATKRLDLAHSMFSETLQLREQHLPNHSKLIVAAKAAIQFCEISSGDSVNYSQLAQTLMDDDVASGIAVKYVEMQLSRSLGSLEEACQLYAEVVTELTEMLGHDHPLRILAVGEFAGLLWERGDYRQGLVVAREAIDLGRKLAPKHRQLRGALSKLGYELLRGERPSEAKNCFEECLAIGNPNDSFQFDARHGLMWACLASGDLDLARQQSQQLLDNVGQNIATQTAWVYYSHARLLTKMGQPQQAEQFDQKAFQTAQKIADPPKHAIWLGRLAVIRNHNGDHQGAEHILRQALRIELSQRHVHHPRLADRRMSLALTLRKLGKEPEADELARQALASRRLRLPPTDPRILEAEQFLARRRDFEGSYQMLASGLSL